MPVLSAMLLLSALGRCWLHCLPAGWLLRAAQRWLWLPASWRRRCRWMRCKPSWCPSWGGSGSGSRCSWQTAQCGRRATGLHVVASAPAITGTLRSPGDGWGNGASRRAAGAAPPAVAGALGEPAQGALLAAGLQCPPHRSASPPGSALPVRRSRRPPPAPQLAQMPPTYTVLQGQPAPRLSCSGLDEGKRYQSKYDGAKDCRCALHELEEKAALAAQPLERQVRGGKERARWK
jgi:hypothetical protein